MTLKGRRLIVSADAPLVTTTGPYTYLFERGETDPDWRPRAQFAAKNGAQRAIPSIFLSGNTAMIDVPATELDPPGRDGVSRSPKLFSASRAPSRSSLSRWSESGCWWACGDHEVDATIYLNSQAKADAFMQH